MKIHLSNYPKNFTLKDGREITVRPIALPDEEELIRFMQSIPRAERVFFRDDVTNPELVRNWVRHPDIEHVIALVACHNNQIIANWTLHYGEHGWTRHHGQLRGIVSKDWRRMGIASIVIRELLAIAGGLEIEKVVIELVKPQEDLLKRYRDLGFAVDATLKRWAKDFNDKYHDLIILTMDLEPAWKRMEELIADYGTHGG